MIVFAGKNLREFGLQVSGVDAYGAPQRHVTREQIPGRNGSLLIDERTYADVEVVYHVAIRSHLTENIRGLSDFLLSSEGYQRLEDIYSPDTFCMAAYQNAIDLTAEGYHNRWALFDLTFIRKPQRFLKTGDTAVEYTESSTILNPTSFEARPFIRVYGHGTVTIGDVSIAVAGSSPYTDIDCDLQDAYYGVQNMNKYITLTPNRFPVLASGENTIRVGSGISKIIITPHWWRL